MRKEIGCKETEGRLIDALLKVADMLLGRRDKLHESDADRRQRVSQYFENVSRCLSDISTALRDGFEPWQACSELEAYALKVHWKLDGEVHKPDDENSPMGKVFGAKLATEVRHELESLTRTRGGAVLVLSRLKSGEYTHVPGWNRDRFRAPQAVLTESIIKIEQAAGKFKALAVLASTLTR